MRTFISETLYAIAVIPLFTIVMIISFLAPEIASATSYTFDCTGDSFTPYNATGCVGAEFPLNVSYNYSTYFTANTTWSFPPNVTANTTIYFVVDSNGTTGNWELSITDNVAHTYITSSIPFNSTQGEVSMSLGNWTGSNRQFSLEGLNSSTYSDAYITSICMSDVSYAECEGGGGGGESATSTATSTLTQVALVSTMSFNALLLFLLSLVITIWMWKSFMR